MSGSISDQKNLPASSAPSKQLTQIVNDGHCMGCGVCKVKLRPDAQHEVDIRFVEEFDQYVPKSIGDDEPRLGEDFVCPGAEMNMPALSNSVFGRQPEDSLLGVWRSIRVAYSTNKTIRDSSASGGVTPTLLAMLFDSGRITAAYCVDRGATPYEARGRIVRSIGELENTHGSTYHPVDFGRELVELIESEDRFAIVGLPCQIAGLEMLKQRIPSLKERHVLSIGLFCGGINSFGGMAYYLKGFGVAWDDIKQLEYRYGAWPGRIRLEHKDGRPAKEVPRIRGNTRWKILRYVVGFQGYWMLQRCRMCPDQVSDFADIAVGDPHLERLRMRGGEGFSVVISRTETGEALMLEALKEGNLGEESISRDEAVASQSFTLDNRRHVDAYRRMGSRLNMKYPAITTYDGLDQEVNFHHKVFAFVDLAKIKLKGKAAVRFFYIPWQIFEYLFLTFTPRLFLQRISKLMKNQ